MNRDEGYLGYFDGETWNVRTIRLGEYLGFPKCCIDEFISVDRAPSRKLSGTGYVPCVKCNDKSEEELIAAISENRKCEDPFPEAFSHDYSIKVWL